jgi:1,4-dihydroxy-2-naphthoate octaprenyltransferase
MILAFYPNASQETYRGHVAETMIQSKNIRFCLALFPLLFFFVPMTLLGLLSNLGFNNWILITLGVIVFLMYPIYRYTVGTIYFYYQWELDEM